MNGIIINGEFHEFTESRGDCKSCSLKAQCDRFSDSLLELCAMFEGGGERDKAFVNRGKVKQMIMEEQ